ncbi:hypothetical protein SJ2017_0658 [Shewanella japonica]|uniref:Uncharacterized protein n=1 Tax=Shewanella japonica TaxID=93973 RepID=A0ABM6JHJ2_9GAMM|nr:hypothetical protein SJ2017_0658 [Shewanella japonica]
MNLLKDNIGIILTMVIIGVVVLGGIYYVEAVLENQVQVVD